MPSRSILGALAAIALAPLLAHAHGETAVDAAHTFTFPEVHDEASVTVTLHRTLRVPDDGRTYPLPPSLGTFPARRVPGAESRYPTQVPVLQVPMYQSEALWLGFLESRQGNYPMRIRILSGQTDAVSGERVTLGRDEVPPDAFPSEPQGFVVVPEQPWLDGFRVDEATVRQFVAEPLGLGRSAEEQLDPDAAPAGGIWIGVEPLKAEIWEAERQRAHALSESTMAEHRAMDLASSMGLAPGGGIIQQIFTTHRAESEWSGEVQWLRVELMSSLAWMHATGKPRVHRSRAALVHLLAHGAGSARRAVAVHRAAKPRRVGPKRRDCGRCARRAGERPVAGENAERHRSLAAWLADVLHRIPEHPSNRIDELLPWNCNPHQALSQAA